jgi:hypothetical protein
MISSQDAKEIAQTILSQMGGSNRLKAMIGAQHFSFCADGALQFKFKLCRKANYVKISLNGKDLYDMKFVKVRGTDLKEVKIINDIYNEDLKKIFEDFTGLYLTL